MQTLRICVGYMVDGAPSDMPPVMADDYEKVEPVYLDMPGWSESTVGLTDYDALPENAKRYLKRLEELVAAPIDIISTGPDRVETIVLKHPFEA
jgi:adenylosuccinate synthase